MANRPLKIYLAIPYTDMEDSSFEQATLATAGIIASNDNLNVFSPITHSHPLRATDFDIPGTWDYWEQIDYQFIDWCDEVWVLIPEEGMEVVQKSKGVQAEIKYATSLGTPVKQAKMNQLMKFARKFKHTNNGK